MTFRHTLLFCAALLSTAAHADIYRWTDDDGRTQFADVVPDQYKARAVRVETPPEPTAEQRRAAQELAAKQKARAAQGPVRAAAAPVPAAPSRTPTPAAPAPTDCASQYRAYRESQECFAPYRMARGLLNPAAYERCTEVVNPADACGPEKFP